jgi:hypothetical protein
MLKYLNQIFATLIGLSGIPGKQYISNIERGICLPPINRINTIAKVLEVNPRIIYLAMKHDDLKKLKNSMRNIYD